MRILLVEDEKKLAKAVKKGLVDAGFAVDLAFDGEEGQYLAENEPYDLLVLDIMLPKIDGITVCKHLRNKNIKTPVLMLTAKNTIEDKVNALDGGADDYLTKPFAFMELKSRINALIRRSRKESSPVIKLADLAIDSTNRTVLKSGENVVLTPKEFSILELLARHKDEVVTRTMIIDHVWDYNFDGMSNVVDVFVATLRRKVGKKLIKTVHGVGYEIIAD